MAQDVADGDRRAVDGRVVGHRDRVGDLLAEQEWLTRRAGEVVSSTTGAMLPGAIRNAIEQARCGVSLMEPPLSSKTWGRTSRALARNAAAGEHIAQNRTKLEEERKYCLDQPISR